MSSLEETKNTKKYWRSLDELADTPEFQDFVAKEFPNHAENWLQAPNRRQFLQVMGASLALAGLTACRWPKEEILPFASNPEGMIPGVPQQYATAFELDGFAQGLLVSSYDGRPIKIEGNPLHPGSLGAANTYAQASVLELYDPERSRYVKREKNASTWEAFMQFAGPHFESLRQNRGAGLRILSETSSSPSLSDMRARFLAAFPEAKWFTYTPLSRDSERDGSSLAFGRQYRTHLALDKADVIACFDSDLLMTHPNAVRHARDYAKRRNPDNNNNTMSRIYAVEGVFSITGSKADHRLAVPPSRIESVILGLAGHLFYKKNLPIPAGVAESALRQVIEARPPDTGYDAFIGHLADDLYAHQGSSVLAAGPRLGPELHALVHILNAALGNVGQTVTYTDEPSIHSGIQELDAFGAELNGGQIDTLVILGGNPVYDGRSDWDFAQNLPRVANAIHLSLFDNETSELCNWHVPRAHYLESWGDARAMDGTISIVQPLIEPLYGGKSDIELLASLTHDAVTSGYEIVQRTLAAYLTGDFKPQWERSLYNGIVDNTKLPAVTPALTSGALMLLMEKRTALPAPSASSLEIVFLPDFHTWDGRFANNGWLQETPDPMTKVTWDNALLMSPATARELKIKQGESVNVTLGGKSAGGCVYIMPGQANHTIAVTLGQGRTRAGKIGNKKGFDYYTLRTRDFAGFAPGATLKSGGRKYKLATTQNHQAIDEIGLKATAQRLGDLVREASLDEYLKHPDFAKHVVHQPPLSQLWDEHPYEGYRWGMAIDLNSCTGCNACVVACQAENNIPVVGKDEVERGREMAWIRIDRYFKGDMEAPEVVHQPVTCHHCENAPCEQVCLVAATVHDKDGLNVMVYNRCIGTRYCSNNCPYKVRRFNYFNNHKKLSEVEKMVYNPEVTIRSRGVMEKCTYCTQRINAVKIQAKNDGRQVRDGEITPACAQTCPSQAIVFGDLNDRNSRVRKLHDHNRSYGMLSELNVRPRTAYLAKLSNPAEAAHDSAPKDGHG